MIKFRCPHCKQKLGVPDEYASRRVRCSKCSQPLTVPAQQPALAEQPAKSLPPQTAKEAGPKPQLKFRCPSCSQKLAVPAEYAGRRVRCSKCSQPATVPAAQPQPVPQPVAPEAPATQDAFAPGMWDDLQLQEPDPEPTVDNSLQQHESQSSFTPPARTATHKGTSRRTHSDSAFLSFAKNAGKVPLALGASIIFTLVGAAIWTGIVSATGFMFYWLAVPVACLAGVGLTVLLESRNFGLGLLAALIGFGGVMSGKAFIAKRCVMPKMITAIDHLFEEVQSKKLTNKEVKRYLESKHLMFTVTCMQLVDDGKFEQEFAEQIILAYYTQHRSKEYAEDEQLETTKKEVFDTLDSWSLETKERVLRNQWPRAVKYMAGVYAGRKFGKAFGFGLAFLSTFSFWDLFCIPAALWGAYKIGAE